MATMARVASGRSVLVMVSPLSADCLDTGSAGRAFRAKFLVPEMEPATTTPMAAEAARTTAATTSQAFRLIT
jgi:hypothetical protein